MQYKQPYIAPILTVDLVAFQIIDAQLCVLLIRRPQEPFKGVWALPGGYNPKGETTIEALARIINEKVSIDINKDLSYIEQLYTFDTVARDPRGHAVSVTYMGVDQHIEVPKTPNEATFFPVNDLPEVAYDHAAIIEYAKKRLASKITYTNAAYALLPKYFTLTDLQSVYEITLGHEIDKRNFRKKFLGLDLIRETGKIRSSGAHRPAKLYEFRTKGIEEIAKNFG